MLPLSDDYMIFERDAAELLFLGETISELHCGVNTILRLSPSGISFPDRIHMVPRADFVIKDGEVLVVIGKEKDNSEDQ